MEREFKIIPIEEDLDPDKTYYLDTIDNLSKEILETFSNSIVRFIKVYDGKDLNDSEYILLEENTGKSLPGLIRHSFYMSKDLLYTYVI